MTLNEQSELIARAGRYLAIAEYCNRTSFSTLIIGLPLTLVAYAGLSIWPGVIFFAVSWVTYQAGDRLLAQARTLRKTVEAARR